MVSNPTASPLVSSATVSPLVSGATVSPLRATPSTPRSAWRGLASRGARAGVAASALLLFACGNADPDRPAYSDSSCKGPTCFNNGQGGSGNGGSGSGGSDSGGSAGASADTLMGNAAVINESLTGYQAYSGRVHVTAEAAGGGFVEADSNDEGSFEISGVSPLAGWVGVEAPGQADLLPTLQPMNLSVVQDQTLLLMRSSTLELFILAANSTVVSDPAAGHILIHVVDAVNGFAIPGVGLGTNPGAELVLFDDGNSFTANADTTGSRGYLMLVNVPVSAYPGQLVALNLEVDGQAVPVETRAARGAVSVFDLAL